MCFQKCVLKMSGDSDLNVGEMTCVDRCVSKYMEAQDKVCGQRNWRRVVHCVCGRLEEILSERGIWSRVLAIIHISPRLHETAAEGRRNRLSLWK